MEIILLKDIDQLGDKHDIVKVKNGYGRNFLIPQGVGVIANATNRKKLDGLKEEEAKKEVARVDEYKEIAAKLDGKTIKIGVKAGTSGKIFGSITTIQIARAIEDQKGYKIDRKRISLIDDIKEIGEHNVMLNLGENEEFEIALNITGEE